MSTAIGVSISPGMMTLARMPHSALSMANCLVKAFMSGFRDLVGDQRIVLDNGKGGDHDNNAGTLLAHDGDDILAGHDGSPEVNGGAPVEYLFGEIEQCRVTAAEADADVVMQNINLTPSFMGRGNRRSQRRASGHIRLEGEAISPVLSNHRCRLLGRGEVAVDGHDPGAFLGKSQGGRPPIAECFAGTLTGADNDGRLPFQTHRSLHDNSYPLRGALVLACSILRNIV